ncbi:hypothetical protein EDD21DRAFT_418996 [Dissophora ornata]|nr:hypothetical protein BGZ58_001395 [Dissophora ornata]KAI8597138.1 hypothetical protein EDD21DRAFT_418996 [Dissophora ornata]
MSEPTQKEISIPWPGKSAIAVTLTIPPDTVERSGYGLLLGPGAGGDEKTALLTAVANEVARHGHFCARYRAKVPNLGFRVSLCTRVVEHLFHPATGVHPLKGCFLGGHSMGTRVAGTVAAQLAAKDPTSTTDTSSSAPAKKTAAKGKKATPSKKSASAAAAPSDFPPNYISGLIFFSYPLHTADNTKALRDQILYDIPSTTPTLFISGLKDTMCQPTLLAKVFKDMKASPREVVQVSDADHGLGFGSSKPAQGKKEALIDAISEWTMQFMDEAITIVSKKSQGDGYEVEDKAKTVKKSVAVTKKAELKKMADEWTVAVSTVA